MTQGLVRMWNGICRALPSPAVSWHGHGMIASAVYARMQEAGLKFRGEPITFEEGDGLKAGIGTKVAYFDDPDGTHLELIQPVGLFQRKKH
jgi:hypothetical protein